MKIRTLISSVSVLAMSAVGGVCAAQTAQAPKDVFTLGELQVTAKNRHDEPLGGATAVQADLQKFNKLTLDQAIDLIPGATASNSGGSRNEQLIFIRGFDRFQTTLSIDGIRVYLPADNRLDFGRFLTADLSEIQVAKGYVSVLDGPGGLGGAINLVTRRPTDGFDAEVRAGLTFDGQPAYDGYNMSAVVGSKQDKYYLQATAARNWRTHFRLSDDFTPTVNEDGGDRDHSYAHDWSYGFKAGLTPNDTDEYSLNYRGQWGSKGAPYHVSDPIASQRYWDWPYWDIDSFYWLSNTALGSKAYVKTKAYYNTFHNGLFSYDDPAQTRQTLPRSFRSYYDDKAYGGSVEAGADVSAADVLKAAFHVRRDDHVEWQDLYAPRPSTEPKQTTQEDTFSIAAENSLKLGDKVDVVTGVSYDWRVLHVAQDFANNALINYPLADSDAFNWQGAATYRFSDTSKVYASVSSRTRFPTIFERFSSRFGGAISNPDLKPERAVNLEVGGSAVALGRTRLEGAVFYSRVTDAIQSVNFICQAPLPCAGQNVAQSRNVGTGDYYGLEASAVSALSDTVTLGGNYTYTQRVLRYPQNPAFRLTGLPLNRLFAWLDWRLGPVTVTPSVDVASGRWTVTTNGLTYYKTDAYALANLGVRWAFTRRSELSVGVKNLLAENYTLVDGFPEEGRNFYATVSARF